MTWRSFSTRGGHVGDVGAVRVTWSSSSSSSSFVRRGGFAPTSLEEGRSEVVWGLLFALSLCLLSSWAVWHLGGVR